MTEPHGVEPYKPSFEPLPDPEQLQERVLGESRRGLAKPIVAGAVTALVIVGGLAYNRWGGDRDDVKAPAVAASVLPSPTETSTLPETAEPETTDVVCYSPAVEKTFKGDPNAASDIPEDWAKGVTVTIKSPKGYGYQGSRIGFHGPDERVDAAEWSLPLSPSQLKDPALMRIGPDTFTITVENIGTPDSAVCNEDPNATFTAVKNDAALNSGAFEPDF